MADFRYAAYGSDGRLTEGRVEAPTEEEAVKLVRAKGLFPTEVTKADARPVASPRSGAGLPLPALVSWSARMAALTAGDVALDRALELTASSSKPGPMERTAQAMLTSIRAGQSLGDAATATERFAASDLGFFRASDQTGSIADAFDAVHRLNARRLALSRTVRTALTYPALLALVALGSVILMLGVVVPKFETLFEDVGTIPLAARSVLAASVWMRTHAIGLSLGGIVTVCTLWAVIRTGHGGALARVGLGLVPGMGRIADSLSLSAVLGNLAGFLRAGVTAIEALTLAVGTAPQSGLARGILGVTERLQKGATISDALAQVQGFPEDIAAIIRAGEESGRLEPMLELVASTESAEAEARIKRLLAIIEPLMILLIGAVVGGIIFSIFQAILSINDVVL